MGDARVVVVSGAASGLGLASAVRFATAGWDVGLIDMDRVRGEQAARRIRALGRQAVFCACDVTDQGQVSAAAREITRGLGSVDALHNNAEADWDRLHDVTVKGIFHMTWAFVPLMAGRAGAAISQYRLAPRRPSRRGAGGLRRRQGSGRGADPLHGRRPDPPGHQGQLRGARRDRHAAAAPLHQGVRLPAATAAGLKAKSLFNRFGQPEEVANVVHFLCSEEASFVTGAIWYVDGGWSVA